MNYIDIADFSHLCGTIIVVISCFLDVIQQTTFNNVFNVISCSIICVLHKVLCFSLQKFTLCINYYANTSMAKMKRSCDRIYIIYIKKIKSFDCSRLFEQILYDFHFFLEEIFWNVIIEFPMCEFACKYTTTTTTNGKKIV